MLSVNMSRRGLTGLFKAVTSQRSRFSTTAYNLVKVLSDEQVESVWTSTRNHRDGCPQPMCVFSDVKMQRFYSGKAGGGGAPKKDPKKSFEEHCVVPDVIKCPPEDVINVCFTSGKGADLGNKLTPTDVKDEPVLFEYQAEEGSYHTVLMIDPDAPCRENPEMRYWLHWLIVNVPGCDICSGRVLADYVGAGPPEGTGPHRYVFLVYKQKCELEFKQKPISYKTVQGRPKFNLKEFVDRNNLDHPVAGNFYLASYDNYVPILYHQLGVK